MAPKAKIKKVEDDDENGTAKPTPPAAAPEPPANLEDAAEEVLDKKDGFTEERAVLRIVSRLAKDDEATAEVSESTATKGLPRAAGDYMSHAVVGKGKGRYLVVTTTRGRKYARKF